MNGAWGFLLSQLRDFGLLAGEVACENADHIGSCMAIRVAVIYRYRTGIPWRDLPERYGHWKAVHRRYRRWCKSGVFMRVFEIMSGDADDEFVMLDATIVRAHQHSAGAQKKTARIKRSAARVAD